MRIELENMERMSNVKNMFGTPTTNNAPESIGGGQHMNIERYALDYQDVPIEGDSIIYCDIPYKDSNCGSYQGFDHDRFYEWALKQTIPIYISEYQMPDDFVMIKGIQKRQLSTANGATDLVTEGIWVPRKVAEELKQKCSYQMNIFDFMED